MFDVGLSVLEDRLGTVVPNTDQVCSVPHRVGEGVALPNQLSSPELVSPVLIPPGGMDSFSVGYLFYDS